MNSFLLLKAEEMIKREMVTMLHHDAIVAPSDNQIVVKRGTSFVHNQTQHLDYLGKFQYDDVSEEEMKAVLTITFVDFVQLMKWGIVSCFVFGFIRLIYCWRRR